MLANHIDNLRSEQEGVTDMEEPTNYITIEGLDKEGIEKLLQTLEQEHTDKFKE